MRKSVSAFRYRSAYQAAFVILLAGFSAACSDSGRFSHGLLTGSTENQRTILGDNSPNTDPYNQPMPPVADNSVTRQPLPPPPAATYTSAPPAYAAATTAPGNTTYGWIAVGGQVVRVANGETLDTLANRYAVPAEQILAANQFSSPASIQPGRVVVIPVRTAMAAPPPAVTPPAQVMPATYTTAPTSTASAIGGSTYVVQSGDTLFSIARRTNMRPTEIASLNGLQPDTMLQVGQTLRLKAGAAVVASATPPTTLGAPPKTLGTLTVRPGTDANAGAAVATETVVAATPPAPPVVPTIPVTKGTEDATTTTVSTSAVDNAVDPPSADGSSFRWPVRGRIISGFGSKPNGERNDGINLAVPEGTSVKAAEAGTVIYAGNELAGYGNLVLIRHANGWVSAYAHNKDLLVARGDTVRRGQIIAHAGMTGSVSAPQVHFELRKGAKPVNPLDYLAGV